MSALDGSTECGRRWQRPLVDLCRSPGPLWPRHCCSAFGEGFRPELREDFAKTGTTHLLAISGLREHSGGAGKSRQCRSAGQEGTDLHRHTPAFVWVYAVLTGFSPPVVRAAIMASLYLWAIFLGRQRSGLTALFCSRCAYGHD